MGSWHTYIYCKINITFIKPSCHSRVFNPHLRWAQSMSHLPAKGEVKPMTTNWVPNVGPMVCGHSATCLQQPGLHPNPALALPSANWYRVATWCLTSKSQMKLVLSSWECEGIWHLPGTQPPNFGSRVGSDFVSAHSGWNLSMCTICTNFVCASLREGLCPNYHWGTSKFVVISPKCSPREWMWDANHPRRTLFLWRKFIPGGLRCLRTR